ncbi:hypothetical protein [Vibrio albus]|uniref:hypothetical protein n=1 Tax=Vibrio albus TaxID=2200953 RepID=UPI0015E83FC4|nr:hypothetical protein [Vibrio albus]
MDKTKTIITAKPTITRWMRDKYIINPGWLADIFRLPYPIGDKGNNLIDIP